tara:strand:- start:153 stop:413 length:261 start_codon:yes stop_codon:yes gene_type:complete
LQKEQNCEIRFQSDLHVQYAGKGEATKSVKSRPGKIRNYMKMPMPILFSHHVLGDGTIVKRCGLADDQSVQPMQKPLLVVTLHEEQ